MHPKFAPRLLLPLLAIALLCGAPCARAFQRVEVGHTIENFSLDTLAGGEGSLNAAKGKMATVVVFWAAWSPRSGEEMADLQALYAEHAANGLGVVAVNVEHPDWRPEEVPTLQTAVKTAGATYPVLLDKDYTLFNRFGVVATPSTMVLDGQGKVSLIVTSYSTGSKTDLKDEVLRLLGKGEAPEAAVATNGPAVHKNTSKASRYLNQGRLLRDRKQFSHAVKPLLQALVEDPECADAYKLLAEIYEKIGQPAEAAAAVKRAQELDAGSPKAAEAPAAPETPSVPPAQENEEPKDNHTSAATPHAAGLAAR